MSDIHRIVIQTCDKTIYLVNIFQNSSYTRKHEKKINKSPIINVEHHH